MNETALAGWGTLMREKQTLTDSDPVQRSRRTILKVIGGVSAGLGTIGVTSAQNQTEIRLGGQVFWLGRTIAWFDTERDESHINTQAGNEVQNFMDRSRRG